jgi:hypothetical protein
MKHSNRKRKIAWRHVMMMEEAAQERLSNKLIQRNTIPNREFLSEQQVYTLGRRDMGNAERI